MTSFYLLDALMHNSVSDNCFQGVIVYSLMLYESAAAYDTPVGHHRFICSLLHSFTHPLNQHTLFGLPPYTVMALGIQGE